MAHNKQAFSEAIASLTDLFKNAGDRMNDLSDAAELKPLLPNVDFACEHFYSLSSSLSDTGLVPSFSITKADFKNEYLGFKTTVYGMLT